MTPARRALVSALVLVVLFVALFLRRSEGRRALSECDAASARSDHAEAIMAARAAAEARCPLLCVEELGYARLYAIAKDAEGRGDNGTAFAAWRAVRSASLASAVFDVRGAKRERADVEIARLAHRLEPASNDHRLEAALASTDEPSGLAFLVLAVGGLVFAAGVSRFVSKRGLSRADLVMAAGGAVTAAAGVLFF